MDLQKRFLIIFASIFALTLLSLYLYKELFDNGEKIVAAGENRYQSYLLADELRQSSDELTRMARSYVITGDPKYKKYFDRILAIRNGDVPRPLDYHNIYWDFVVANGVAPRVDLLPKSLKQLMREAEFTETEFALLRETESESNELVDIENRAMDAVAGMQKDDMGFYSRETPDADMARELMYSDQYHQAKVRIMKPLEKFFNTVDHRTSQQITTYHDKQKRMDLILLVTLSLSACLALLSLLLGTLSLKKKKQSVTDGKSKLAQRLAASGYPSSAAGGKVPPHVALARKAQTGAPAEAGKARHESPDEEFSWPLFVGNLWQSWPLISAAVVVTFMTLGLSWWFISENEVRSYTKVRNELKFTLDASHDSVLDWLSETSRDTENFAYAVRRQFSSDTLRWIKDHPEHTLHGDLANLKRPNDESRKQKIGEELKKFAEDSKIIAPDALHDYVVVDLEGMVLSSNRNELIGRYITFPGDTMERLLLHDTIVNFPNQDTADEFLSQKIIFGSLIDKSMGAVFIITSPGRMLAKILRRGYTGHYGEVYLVNAEGRFISEPRWQEQSAQQEEWARPESSSVVGRLAAQYGQTGGNPFPLPVGKVIAGDDGMELNEYDNYLGDKVVGSWHWDNTYGFGIINEFKSHDAFATFRAYRQQALAGSGLTAGLILALVFIAVWSRNKVTRSNKQLKSAFSTIKSHNDKLAEDLRIGKRVQMDMLPDPIQGDGFNLEAFLKPAQSVSGDFYDFSLIRDEKVYFCVGDVSGKGIPASLFMSVTKSMLNKVLDLTDQTKEIVTRINQELSSNNDSNMFVTLIVGIIDLKTGKLLITNAGHNLPYVKKRTGEVVCLEQVQGPLVGTFEDVEFTQQSVDMDQGDMILFYTDGVTEAQNIRDEFYEDQRLEELLEQHQFSNAKDMTSTVYRSVIRFIGQADQFDDITILALQYTG